MAVLPHDSPGYPEWDVAEQPRLLEVIKNTGNGPLPGELDGARFRDAASQKVAAGRVRRDP